MIAVCTVDPAYRAAVAELTRTVTGSSRVGGSVRVVGGGAWCRDALDALSAGASAVVVSRPDAVDTDQARAVREAAGTRPVIVERRHLNEDALRGHAAVRGAAIVIECVAAELDPHVVRDAAGWIRVLAGDAVTITGAEATAHTALAVGVAGAAPVSVVVTRRAVSPVLLRAQVLGSDRVEVTVGTSVHPRVHIDTRDGRTLVTSPLESPARRALRRAAEAVQQGLVPHDLDDLRADESVAQRILAPSL